VLCNPAPLLREARAQGYALPAFNTIGVEVTRGLVSAAESLHSPIIIQTSVKTVRHYGPSLLAAFVNEIARKAAVPVALHLDHCNDIDLIGQCIDAGWTSVMIDASCLPLKDNIARTRAVVCLAHSRGVSVEGELGEVGGVEEDVFSAGRQFVRPDEVEIYVSETGLDMLAVGVGTFHGRGNDLPRIRFDLLEESGRATPVPLVLHGGTGIPQEDITRAIARGVAKINISTEIKECVQMAIRGGFQDHSAEPLAFLASVEDAVRRLAVGKLTAFRNRDATPSRELMP
jgi:tagatose 1,6-diphosphate aldolase GatY/KbaY